MTKYNPTPEQQSIITSEDSALVIAGPGKGKTATAVAAAKEWLVNHKDESQKVVFTSFSNAAVRRIAESAKIDLSSKECRRLHFRTFHGWAMEILHCYGRFVGLRAPATPMDNIEETLVASECRWESGNDGAYLQCLKDHAKETGKIPFDLMIPLATSLLENSATIRRACAARYPFIIVDEFQDTRPEQWRFMKAIGGNSRILALGDPNQMIYEKQHQMILDRMNEFEAWKSIRRSVFNGQNFRCEYAGIVEFAEAMLNSRRIDIDNLTGVQKFVGYPNQRRATLAAIWAEIRRQVGHDVTVAFIVPSANTARQIADDLKHVTPTQRIPIPIKAYIETNQSDIDSFRLATCAAIDYSRCQNADTKRKAAIALAVLMTSWSRKQMSDQLITTIESRLSPKSRAKSPLREYLLCGENIDCIETYSQNLLDAMEHDTAFGTAAKTIKQHGKPKLSGMPLGQLSLFDEYRTSRAKEVFDGHALSKAKTNIVSMYKAKGREFDFVVMVVEPRAHSQRTTLEELRRLYYVTATRARRWLGVLYVPDRLGDVLGPVLERSL